MWIEDSTSRFASRTLDRTATTTLPPRSSPSFKRTSVSNWFRSRSLSTCSSSSVSTNHPKTEPTYLHPERVLHELSQPKIQSDGGFPARILTQERVRTSEQQPEEHLSNDAAADWTEFRRGNRDASHVDGFDVVHRFGEDVRPQRAVLRECLRH